MNTLEAELSDLHDHGLIDAATAARAVALERREIFSVYAELRAAMYGAVLLLTTGVGLLLREQFTHLGPPAIIVALLVASAACYGYALRALWHGRRHTVVADYVLLLGALLLSADLAYAESCFDLLGAHWSWHLLLLAALHATTAYVFGSTLLLAVALTALAGWLGVTTRAGSLLAVADLAAEVGVRGFVAAAAIQLWRRADRTLRPATKFTDVFDHYAAHLAFWSALAWCSHDAWRLAGFVALITLAVWAIWHGLARHSEAFVVYGVSYGALGLCIVATAIVHGATDVLGLILLIVLGAAFALWQLHGLLRGGGR